MTALPTVSLLTSTAMTPGSVPLPAAGAAGARFSIVATAANGSFAARQPLAAPGNAMPPPGVVAAAVPADPAGAEATAAIVQAGADADAAADDPPFSPDDADPARAMVALLALPPMATTPATSPGPAAKAATAIAMPSRPSPPTVVSKRTEHDAAKSLPPAAPSETESASVVQSTIAEPRADAGLPPAIPALPVDRSDRAPSAASTAPAESSSALSVATVAVARHALPDAQAPATAASEIDAGPALLVPVAAMPGRAPEAGAAQPVDPATASTGDAQLAAPPLVRGTIELQGATALPPQPTVAPLVLPPVPLVAGPIAGIPSAEPAPSVSADGVVRTDPPIAGARLSLYAVPPAEPRLTPLRMTIAPRTATLPASSAPGNAPLDGLAPFERPVRFVARSDAGLTAAPGAAVTVVAAPASAAAPPLDLADRRWPGAMIDRIEQLRDAADARDTRIRVVPDALGPIDLAVQRRGGTVDVVMTAAHETTRALLAAAEPTLRDIAADRGIALGRTQVDAPPTPDRPVALAISDTPRGGQTMTQADQQPPRQAPHQQSPRQPASRPTTPSRAPVTTAADDDRPAASRIA